MKIIKIFVSSLFHEMMLERDILHRQISAMITKGLEGKKDIELLFVDLRWGIDSRRKETEYEKSDYILEKCFEAIDDCDLFLGIIASEYGTIANPDVVKKYLGEKNENFESYTSLEIKYALRHIPPERMLFMMTEPSLKDNSQIVDLKKHISEQYIMRYYQKETVNGVSTVSDDFISGITEMICETVEKLELKETNHQKKWFYRTQLMEHCFSSVGKNNIVLLTGDSGCGKSVTLQMICEKAAQQDTCIYCSSVFLGKGKTDLKSDLKRWTGLEDTLEKMLKSFQEMIIQEKHPCMIFLDSIDEMDTTELFVLYSKIVQLPPEKVILFLSTSRSEKIAYLSGLDIKHIDANRLEDNELIPFMKHIAAQSNKQLFDEVCSVIVSRGEIVHNTLYLSILIHQLILMNASAYMQAYKGKRYLDTLIQQMISSVETLPDTIEEIILWKLRDMDAYVNPQFSTFLFELMSVYQLPISLSTIRKVYMELTKVEWSDMDYYMYSYYLRGFLVEKDGYLFFSHNLIRKCVYTSYSKIDEEKYLNSILNCLHESSKDLLGLYMVAGRIRQEVIVEALKENHDAEIIKEALQHLFYAYFPYLRIEFEHPFVALFQKIEKTCGTQMVIDLLIHLISNVNLGKYIEGGVYFYLRILKMLDSAKAEYRSLMELIECFAGMISEFGVERMGVPVINYYFKLISEEKTGLTWYAEYAFEETESATYFIYDILKALDQIEMAKRLQDISIYFMKQSSSLRVFYPSIIQDLTQKEPQKAYELCIYLLNRFKKVEEPISKSIYGNLLYAYMTLQAQRKEFEKMDETIKQMYVLFREQYEEDNLNINYIYNYSLGLSALVMTSDIRRDKRAANNIYRELIALRIHLCKLEPNSYMFLSALSGKILEVVKNDYEIGIDHFELLEVLYQYITNMTKRGNPRACWLLSALFKASDKSEKFYQFFINKLMEIETFLNPIMEMNKGKKDLVEEIVYTYLRIYETYCNMEILPLKNGHHLLRQLYLFSKNELAESASDMDLSIMLFEVFQQLFAVFISEVMQGEDMMSIFKDSEYKDFREFAEEQYKKQECPATMFLLAGAECTDAYLYVSILMDMQKRSDQGYYIFMMTLERIGLDINKNILEHCGKAITLLEKNAKNKISIPTNILLLTFAGIAYLTDSLKNSKYTLPAKIMRERLFDMMPEELRAQLIRR